MAVKHLKGLPHVIKWKTVEEDLTLATTETNQSKVETAGQGTGLTGQTEKVNPGEI